ncbi:HalOD1 output domain-containing protein [Natrinema soli]|uniref:HalOD1 output domain-containing protein n=1 Tax=Natrinema soli TaxID=1930624 RepID=A0ABD5SI42_9EURY|nr:HalOD1 output domain-containing protein [Natrinema soli]
MVDSDSGREAASVEYDWSTIDPSIAVLECVSAFENEKPCDLSINLYEYINPISLNELVANDSPVTVIFTFDKYLVRVDRNGLEITFPVV